METPKSREREKQERPLRAERNQYMKEGRMKQKDDDGPRAAGKGAEKKETGLGKRHMLKEK